MAQQHQATCNTKECHHLKAIRHRVVLQLASQAPPPPVAGAAASCLNVIASRHTADQLAALVSVTAASFLVAPSRWQLVSLPI
jgi:hypothetical protein